MSKKLKVGFDFDGVILYNPIRAFRILAASLNFLKPLLFQEKPDKFYFPKTQLEKFFWQLLHKTSLWPADGLKELKQLVDKNIIEAYLITGRYSFLKDDFENWLNKINAQSIFTGCFYNQKNLQPNQFKEKMIKQLKLDIFVEDNFGIIQKLNSHTKAKIFWITNFFDQHLSYQYKFNNLKEVILFLKRLKNPPSWRVGKNDVSFEI